MTELVELIKLIATKWLIAVEGASCGSGGAGAVVYTTNMKAETAIAVNANGLRFFILKLLLSGFEVTKLTCDGGNVALRFTVGQRFRLQFLPEFWEHSPTFGGLILT